MEIDPVTPESKAQAREAQARERQEFIDATGCTLNTDGRIQVADNGEPDPERKPAC